MMTRRKVMIGGAALGAAALGVGTLAAFRYHYSDWLLQVLRQALPGHAIEPEGFALYVREYAARKRAAGAIRLELYAMAETVANPGPLLPDGLADKVAEEERRIVTEFLMGSDFFLEADPPRTVTYLGNPNICNPFAVL